MKYFNLYWILIRNAILTELEYRTDLFIAALGGLLMVLTNWVFIEIVFAQFDSIYGWTKYEIILLYGLYRISTGILDGCFFLNLQSISRIITDGRLDMFLLRPVDERLYLLVQKISIYEVSKAFVGLAIVLYAWPQLTIALTLGKIVGFLLSLSLASIIFYGILLSFFTLSFWWGDIGHGYWIYIAARHIGQQLPIQAFQGFGRVMFGGIFPLVLFGAVPAAILLERFDSRYWWIFLFVAIFWSLASDWVWKRGLRGYTSGGG